MLGWRLGAAVVLVVCSASCGERDRSYDAAPAGTEAVPFESVQIQPDRRTLVVRYLRTKCERDATASADRIRSTLVVTVFQPTYEGFCQLKAVQGVPATVVLDRPFSGATVLQGVCLTSGGHEWNACTDHPKAWPLERD
jgi:hypothetical protein